ncbi:hypothetical protein QP028_01545 [Corynebacterium suedekumii]|nr:hypothetical protein QP028_01545 [Corynebacterium suedekumii]
MSSRPSSISVPRLWRRFVDGELTDGALHRARVHLVHCGECRAEIERQRNASEWLRGSNITPEVRAPEDLLARLAGIASGPLRPGPDAESTLYAAAGGTAGQDGDDPAGDPP